MLMLNSILRACIQQAVHAGPLYVTTTISVFCVNKSQEDSTAKNSSRHRVLSLLIQIFYALRPLVPHRIWPFFIAQLCFAVDISKLTRLSKSKYALESFPSICLTDMLRLSIRHSQAISQPSIIQTQ